jgi:hypothetical protein
MQQGVASPKHLKIRKDLKDAKVEEFFWEAH